MGKPGGSGKRPAGDPRRPVGLAGTGAPPPKPVSRWRAAMFQLVPVPAAPLHGARGVRGAGRWTLSS